MTNPYRAMCAELVAIEDALSGGSVQFSNQGQALDGYSALATFRDVADRARALLDQPVAEETDIHYSWELHDAEGEWQAGGSANSLDNVRREGNRYLQTYSQDGPHKLIIQRHCVNTIEEVTND